MPKAYWIARIDVTDPETYKVYASGAAAAFQQYGATYLVRGEAFTAAEGQARSRNVVIEFHRIRRRSIATTPKNIRLPAPIASQQRRARPAGNPARLRRALSGFPADKAYSLSF